MPVDYSIDRKADGPFEARYLAFLETIAHLRPKLHRYCSRMIGSVLDGEDVVQEALFSAYRKLDTFEEGRSLSAWLFGIAHNQCIDYLRRREVRRKAEAEAVVPDWVDAAEPDLPALGRAVEHLVLALPPMERACVLLKDVFDYSLEEIAELVGSTVGGVKSALNRGRPKLITLPDRRVSLQGANAEVLRLLPLYVERFNGQDWDGLRELIRSDARLHVADRFAGGLTNAPYFQNYQRRSGTWKMAVGEVDGEPVVLLLQESEAGWTPTSCVRIALIDGRIGQIVDYSHCPWILPAGVSRMSLEA